MNFKKIALIFAAMAIAVIMAIPAFGETPMEYYNRCAGNAGNGWTLEQEKCYRSTRKYYQSVLDLDAKVREEEADVIRREAEVEAREQALLQNQSAPPEGEFVPAQPEVRLVYRTLYYPYNDGCVIVSGWYPAWWAWPTWWSVGLPPYDYPIYGWCSGRWDHGRRSIVMNNITVNRDRAINRENFRRDVGHAFNSRNTAPDFARKSSNSPGIARGQAQRQNQPMGVNFQKPAEGKFIQQSPNGNGGFTSQKNAATGPNQGMTRGSGPNQGSQGFQQPMSGNKPNIGGQGQHFQGQQRGNLQSGPGNGGSRLQPMGQQAAPMRQQQPQQQFRQQQVRSAMPQQPQSQQQARPAPASAAKSQPQSGSPQGERRR